MRFASRLICVVSLVCGPLASAAVIDANPSNYRSRIDSLQPGDTLRLASGTYTQGLPLRNMAGTAANPIVIEGPADQSAVFQANSCCNTVQLESSSYIVIRNLTLDGRNLDGPFGVDSRGPCHHITLENLRIVNHGANQATVGISTKGPAWNWVIRRNTIIRAGTGMYLGNSDGTQPFVAGTIENNVILDTIGYNIEIKHQQPRPTGIGMPTTPSRTIIRHNVFSKANNASSGGNARPNLLVGHFPVSGPGADDVYEIYGNFFYQNPEEALFQGEGNLVIHDNVFFNSMAGGMAVNIRPHNDVVRNVSVYHNTVVSRGYGISITGGASGTRQEIVANAVFADTPLRGPNQRYNIADSFANASSYLNNPTGAIGSLDLYPRAGRLSGAAIDISAYAANTDGIRDFNGRVREGRFRGAYEGEGANNGWKLALSMKPTPGGAAPPQVTLTAEPQQVSLQGSSTLTWTTSGATSCTASGGWSGERPLSGSEEVGPLTATTSYVLTCTGAEGTGSATAVVSVVQGTPAPTVNLAANPTTVSSGGFTQLTWTSTNATSCTASGDWSGTKPTSGTELVSDIVAAREFVLTCTGSGGTASDSVTVGLASGPSVSLAADPASVQVGGSTVVTWSATNSTGCTASGGWSGNKPTSGSESVGPLNSSTTLTLTCEGEGGSASRSVQIEVTAPSQEEPGSSEGSGGGVLDPRTLAALGGLLWFAWRRRRTDMGVRA